MQEKGLKSSKAFVRQMFKSISQFTQNRKKCREKLSRMLLSKLLDRECFGIISVIVIHHTLYWSWTNEAVKERFLLTDGERLDNLWLSIGYTSVILAKYSSVHGRYAFLAYGLMSSIVMCLVTYISSSSYLIFFTLSASSLWGSIDVVPSIVPKSFSFGEVALVLQLFCNWIGRMFQSIQDRVTFTENVRLKWTGSTLVAAVIMASFVVGVSKARSSFPACIIIYTIHAGFSVAFLTWMFQANFLTWVILYSFQDCMKIMLLVSWILVCAVTVVWTVSQAIVMSSVESPNEFQSTYLSSGNSEPTSMENQLCDNAVDMDTKTDQRTFTSNMSKKSSISYETRKVFHLFILLVYIPGLLLDPEFLFLSSCAAFGLFIIFEVVRALRVPFVGQVIDCSFRPFTDERDQGPLFLTHIYLLVGLSLPVWITSWPLQGLPSSVRLYSGILALGIGDTIACVAGSAYGRHQWPGTRKTIEGTVAAIVAQLIFVYILISFDLLHVPNLFNLWIGVTLTCLVEAFTDQIDNLVLPLVLFPFLC